jgi:hypothetical protein
VRSPATLRGRLHGRRLGDPVDIETAAGTRPVRGRLAAVSVRAAVAAGAWVGFALGLVVGGLLGATIVWFAGSILEWQRDLAFTFGIARRLLPLGDQIGLLRDIGSRWWFVIPAVTLAVAILSALVGGLLGGIFAAIYNRSPRHALVVVELPEGAPAARETVPGEPDAVPAAHQPGAVPSARKPVLHSAPHGDDREE